MANQGKTPHDHQRNNQANRNRAQGSTRRHESERIKPHAERVAGQRGIKSRGSEPVSVGEPPKTYTVKAGDTLGKIAKKLGVTVESLMAENGITDSNKVYVGQKLKVSVLPRKNQEKGVANRTTPKPLLATDYSSLEDLKKDINIEYNEDKSVDLELVSHPEINHKLTDGVGDKEIKDLKNQASKASLLEKANIAFDHPQLAWYRNDLQAIETMSYRKKNIAELGLYNIADAFRNDIESGASAKELGDKGLVNTFNHTFGQSVITMLFGENVADLAGDIHERDQPALRTGEFKNSGDITQAIDNYVDIMNNQIGQDLGADFKKKFAASLHFGFTPEASAELLNEGRDFFAKSFNLKFGKEKYTAEDDLAKRFCIVLNEVKHGRKLAEMIKSNLYSENKK